MNELCQLTSAPFLHLVEGEWEGGNGGREEEKQLREEGGRCQLS